MHGYILSEEQFTSCSRICFRNLLFLFKCVFERKTFQQICDYHLRYVKFPNWIFLLKAFKIEWSVMMHFFFLFQPHFTTHSESFSYFFLSYFMDTFSVVSYFTIVYVIKLSNKIKVILIYDHLNEQDLYGSYSVEMHSCLVWLCCWTCLVWLCCWICLIPEYTHSWMNWKREVLSFQLIL